MQRIALETAGWTPPVASSPGAALTETWNAGLTGWNAAAKRANDYVTRRFDTSSARLKKPVGLEPGRNTA